MDDKIYNFHQLSRVKGFKIVHLNIRSLPRKIDQLRLILTNSNIDIFTLSETWLHKKIDPHLIHIQGYKTVRLDRATSPAKKRGGGLLIYVKEDIDVQTQEQECMSSKDLEIQWIRIKRPHSRNILLANIYRPPGGNLNQAIKLLGKGINSIRKLNEELVILGDFNVDYSNKKSPSYKKVKFFEKANSLDQMINTTTRNTKKTSSLLDVAFTHMKFVTAAGALDSFLSDHQPIFIIKKKTRNGGKSDQQFEGRSYKHYDKQKFTNRLTTKNWIPFYEAKSPTLAWEIMQNNIKEVADDICPTKTFKIKNTKPCWITHELIEQMRDRDYFYAKAKRHGSEDDWNIAKFFRNQVNANIRGARADFIKEQLRNNEGNSAKFWRNIKQVMPSKKGSRTNATIRLTNENDVQIDKNLTSKHLNDFFVNIGGPIKPMNSTGCNLTSSSYQMQTEQTDNIFNIETVSIREVQVLVDKINVSKSSGITTLSSKLLKDSFQALGDKLTFLFNFSIRDATFPDQWKEALVIPIPKAGNIKKAENYRPISLLPLPGKILEKLVHTQLSHYLEENDLLSSSQFGFRKQRSTTHAISQLLNQIYTNINKSVITAAIYIDFSKAFNCVQHSTLLNKLRWLNLDQTFIKWVASYLESRSQRTLANNTYSDFQPVQQGVPRGSVLGPLLYIIYANDIADRIKSSVFTFYADDTVLYSKKKDLQQAAADLQEDLNSLSNWCVDNDIYVNTTKTKTMFFGSRAKLNSIELPTFKIGNSFLERAKTYTYLGIKLDEQLSLDTHANTIIQRVSTKIYHLTKIRSFVTKKAALLIYKNMILPILEYGDIFLHSASQKIRKKLQTLQNEALWCALHKDKYYKSAELHREAKLLKLTDRRHVHMLLHMYQLAQMPDFKMWKAHQPTGVRTRSSKKKLITIRRPKNEKFKKSITYQGPKLWNSLPGKLQKIESYQEFKNHIKKEFEGVKPERNKKVSKSKSKSNKKTSLTS